MYWVVTDRLPIMNGNESDFENKMSTVYTLDNTISLPITYNKDQHISALEYISLYKSLYNEIGYDISYDLQTSILKLSAKYPDRFIKLESPLAEENYHFQYNLPVSENLRYEYNKKTNDNTTKKLKFVRLSDYGLSININGLEYRTSSLPNEVTSNVSNIIRRWLVEHYPSLLVRGILVSIESSSWSNILSLDTLKFTTQYPNVPMEIDVEVGTGDEYYFLDSEIVIYDVGRYFNVNINGIDYGVDSVVSYDNNFNVTFLVNAYSSVIFLRPYLLKLLFPKT
jgi:hypothetical protein